MLKFSLILNLIDYFEILDIVLWLYFIFIFLVPFVIPTSLNASILK